MTQSGLPILTLPQPYLLFLGDTTEAELCEDCFRSARLGARAMRGRVFALPEGQPSRRACRNARLRRRKRLMVRPRWSSVSPTRAASFPNAGFPPGSCRQLEAGLNLISGMHMRLDDVPAIEKAAAARHACATDRRAASSAGHPDRDRTPTQRANALC